MNKKLSEALPLITQDLQRKKVFSAIELRTLLSANRLSWKLPQQIGQERFITSLVELGLLKEVRLTSPVCRPMRRLYVPSTSDYRIALSFDSQAYLSHGTAAHLHDVIKTRPPTIIVNVEQKPKPPITSPLTQESIDKAFAHKQRSSRYILENENLRVMIINGKSTNNLDVVTLPEGGGDNIRVSSLVRTLIDMSVRPAYAGGVALVLEAYKRARRRIRVSDLLSVLLDLNYKYPYSQAIAFYLKRSGYPKSDLEEISKLFSSFRFYLDYGIAVENRRFDSYSNVIYPALLDNLTQDQFKY